MGSGMNDIREWQQPFEEDGVSHPKGDLYSYASEEDPDDTVPDGEDAFDSEPLD